MNTARNQTHDSVVVRKPAATTHFANKYTVQERKLLNVCLWNAQTNDFSRDVHEMQCTTVRELIGATETRNYEWLRDLSRGLVSKTIEWNSVGKDKAGEWTVCTFLASGQIRGGKFRYRLNPEIVEQIRNPRLWGKFKLLAQINIKRKYGLIIYEFLSTELSLAGSGAQELNVKISLALLREVCGLSAGQYENFKDFNKFVLTPAKQEIDQHTDIVVTYEGVRLARRVDELVFNIQRKKQFQFSLPGFDDLPAVKDFSAENASEESLELLALLTSKGVTKKQAVRLVERYSAARINRNVAYTEKQLQKKATKIENLPAYIAKAIESDYQPGPSADDIRKVEEAKEKARTRAGAAEVKAQAETDRKEFEDFQSRRVREAFNSRSKSWQDKRKAAFRDGLPENDFLIRDRIAKGEWDSVIVASAFFGSLRKELLTEPHETSLERYVAWKKANAKA